VGIRKNGYLIKMPGRYENNFKLIKFIIIISLLTYPLLGHRITHKENGP
jgi:hypothetical protein